MAIAHHTYYDGKVQSLSRRNSHGFESSIGWIEQPGEYDFGIAERRERIRVTSGKILAKGGTYGTDSPPLVFEVGQPIKIQTTEEDVTYRCVYDD